MHFSWEKHQKLSRDVANAADKDIGIAMALMGMGITLLLNDLFLIEQQQQKSELNQNSSR